MHLLGHRLQEILNKPKIAVRLLRNYQRWGAPGDNSKAKQYVK